MLETNITCITKIPYTTVSIPLEATYESLNDAMTCDIAEIRDEDVLVACTGQQLYSYKLKVCNPQPELPSSEAGRCPEGACYNEANQCCVKPPAAGAGCVEFQVDMKSCGG